jgi:hypothetical protein
VADACLAAATLGIEALTRPVGVSICGTQMSIAALLRKPSPTISAHLRERFDRACGRHSIAIGWPTGSNQDDVPAPVAARKRAEEMAGSSGEDSRPRAWLLDPLPPLFYRRGSEALRRHQCDEPC